MQEVTPLIHATKILPFLYFIQTQDVKEEGESKNDDDEFVVSADEEDEEAQDEEETLDEQEEKEGAVDHKAEIAELEAEGDLPIEELMKRYAGAYEDEYEYPRSEESDDEEDDESVEDSETEGEWRNQFHFWYDLKVGSNANVCLARCCIQIALQ